MSTRRDGTGMHPFPGLGLPDPLAPAHAGLKTNPVTEAEAEAVGGDLLGKSLRLDGLVHRLEVMPNENATGWIVSVNGAGANVPQAQAQLLARLLLSGPDEGPDL